MTYWQRRQRDSFVCRYFQAENSFSPDLFQITRLRLLMVGLCFFLGFSTLGWRLVDVTVFQANKEELIGQAAITPQRADFVDRHGVLLATSLRTFSLYANPQEIRHADTAARCLQEIFPALSLASLTRKLSSEKRFVWIARHLTPALHAKVLHLGIPGVHVMKDQRRIYPHGPLFSHILGMTTWDHVGVSGLEKGLDARLQNHDKPVRLSVDVRLQHILREELQASIDMFQAKGGNGILIKRNPRKKWEILAIVSLPDFDPNRFQDATQESLFNRNTVGVYEFGSMLKIHNTAMVLNRHVATLHSIYDASVPLRVGRFQITDFKGENRPLSVEEGFLYSSNIVNAKMALAAGAEAQKDFMKKLGFFQPVSLELPELGMPLMPAIWQEATVITASYGYGLAITPLHLVKSVGTLLDGYQRDLTLLPVDEDAPEDPGEPLFSPELVAQIRYLLRKAVMEGRVQKARVEGYDVGGKTGTANIQENGKYRQKQNRASFIGAFPMNEPEYLLLVTVDRPQPNQSTYGYATAGWIAAPLGARIIKRIAPLLGVMPQQASSEAQEEQGGEVSSFLIPARAQEERINSRPR